MPGSKRRLSEYIPAGMPNVFWAEAVNTAVFLENLIPTRALPKGTTPFGRWFSRKPNLKNLRTFGCLAYAWNPDTTARRKFDDRAIKTVLIGYGATGSHYKLFDMARKRIFISRDIWFDETQRYADILGEDRDVRTTVATKSGNDEDSSDDEIDSDIPLNQSESQAAPPSRSPSSPLSAPPRSPSPQAPGSRMVKELDSNLVDKSTQEYEPHQSIRLSQSGYCFYG